MSSRFLPSAGLHQSQFPAPLTNGNFIEIRMSVKLLPEKPTCDPSMLTTLQLYRTSLAILTTVALFTAHSVNATDEAANRGVLDTPVTMPTTGSGAQLTTSANEQAGNSPAFQQALKEERKRLKKLNRNQLMQLANKGERAAQLILAENFADEANHESITIISANDAMSDAAYWYALAARRGFPGAAKVDGVLPLFPLRTVRGSGG